MKRIEVVAAVIKEGDRIYSTRRSDGILAGGWEFPGGKIEDGESQEEALKREIMEELGVTIEVDRRLVTTDYQYPTFHITLHSHLVRITSGELSLSVHDDARWLTVQELDSVEWLPADMETVDRVRDLLIEEE